MRAIKLKIIEEIKYIRSRDYYRLKIAISKPESKEKRPGVLLIHGAAPVDEDATIPGYYHDGTPLTYTQTDTKPFRDISKYLSKRGFVVIRYAKRGVRKSVVDIDYDIYTTTSFSNTVDDVQIVFDYLTTLPEVDKKSIFLVAWSEGTLVAPILAKNNHVKGIVHMGGFSTNLKELLQKEMNKEEFKRYIQRLFESPDEKMFNIDRPASRLKELFQLPPNYQTMMESYTDFLILHGMEDMEVPYKEVEILENQFKECQYTKYKIISYPTFGHGFCPNLRIKNKIYKTLGPFEKKVLEDIYRWLHDRCRNESIQ